MPGMKVTVDAAMRARDVSRPHAEHEDRAVASEPESARARDQGQDARDTRGTQGARDARDTRGTQGAREARDTRGGQSAGPAPADTAAIGAAAGTPKSRSPRRRRRRR